MPPRNKTTAEIANGHDLGLRISAVTSSSIRHVTKEREEHFIREANDVSCNASRFSISSVAFLSESFFGA